MPLGEAVCNLFDASVFDIALDNHSAFIAASAVEGGVDVIERKMWVFLVSSSVDHCRESFRPTEENEKRAKTEEKEQKLPHSFAPVKPLYQQ